MKAYDAGRFGATEQVYPMDDVDADIARLTAEVATLRAENSALRHDLEKCEEIANLVPLYAATMWRSDDKEKRKECLILIVRALTAIGYDPMKGILRYGEGFVADDAGRKETT